MIPFRESEHAPALASSRAASLAGVAAIAIGAIVLAGWGWDIDALKRFGPGFDTMKRSSAAAFICAGIALLLVPRARRAGHRWAIAGCVAVILVVATPGLGERLTGERLAPNTSVCFELIAAALAVLALPRRGRIGPALATGFALTVAAIGAVALAGYASDAAAGYRWGNVSGMALPSAAGFFVLGVALAACVARSSGWSWLLDASTTAVFLVGVAVLLAVCAISYRTLGAFRDTAARLARSHEVRAELGTLQREVAEAGTARRLYLETRDERRAEERQAALQRTRESLDRLARFTAGNRRQERVMAALESMFEGRNEPAIALAAELGASVDGGTPPTGTSILLRLLEAIHDEEDRRRRELERNSDRDFRRAMFVVPIGTVASVALLGVALLRLNRGARERQATLAELRAAEQDLRRQQDEIRQLNLGLERQVEQRTAQLEAANRELEAFSYSVSHDLRAPLRHVQGYVALLQRATAGQLSEKAERHLRVINDASVEMGHLIDDLLDFSRMARVELNQARVRLDDLIGDVRRVLETTVQDRRIEWRVQPLPDVLGDSAMLRQVFANLISNAVKYSRQRSPAVIEIGHAGEENGRAIVFVRDNGAGFDMRYVDKLFGVFQRLHRSDEFEGTGIGLATVRRIVVRHGGRVWAEGEVDRGATFYFTLAKASPAPLGSTLSHEISRTDSACR